MSVVITPDSKAYPTFVISKCVHSTRASTHAVHLPPGRAALSPVSISDFWSKERGNGLHRAVDIHLDLSGLRGWMSSNTLLSLRRKIIGIVAAHGIQNENTPYKDHRRLGVALLSSREARWQHSLLWLMTNVVVTRRAFTMSV